MTAAVEESDLGDEGVAAAGGHEPGPGSAMTQFYHTLDEIFHQSTESEDTSTSLDDGMITMDLCLTNSLTPDNVKLSPGRRHRPQQQQQQEQALLAYNTEIGPALRRNINAWCQATGLPTSITVYVQDRVFKLHKYPLVSRSGYFKRWLRQASNKDKEVKLPSHYPGGPEVFELVVNFCYGSTILMDPSNVAALRCAAHFLDMSEEHGRGNLSERSDVYLTQVALQSWEDTMVVLLQCQQPALLPLAEEVRVVARCVDALAHLACMEVLEPAERQDMDRAAGASGWNESHFWREMSAAMASSRRRRAGAGDQLAGPARDWWVHDLLCLPGCYLFERVVSSIRRQGMQERQVSQVVMRYAERHILGASNTITAGTGSEDEPVGKLDSARQAELVATLVRLLPPPQACAGVVPVCFLFALLRCALALEPQSVSTARLETLIASQLECAGVQDYLLLLPPPHDDNQNSPACFELVLRSMQQIVALFLAHGQLRSSPVQHGGSGRSSSGRSSSSSGSDSNTRAVTLIKVARVWDQYLAEVAHCVNLLPATFFELVDLFPNSARVSHDLLYRAIHRHLSAHPKATEEERTSICRILNCQKLSQEVCAHAVQNELMPLRMLVQAMFLQQVHTRNTLCHHLHSTGTAASVSTSLLQPLGAPSRSSSFRHFQPSSSSRAGFRDSTGYELERHHQLRLVPGDATSHRLQSATLKAEFEATYTRLRNLEEELAQMRRNLDLVAAAAVAEAGSEPGPALSLKVGRAAVDTSRGEQEDRSAGGCLGQGSSSNGLVLKVSRSLHKLRFIGSSLWRTKNGASGGGTSRSTKVQQPPSAADSSRPVVVSAATGMTAPNAGGTTAGLGAPTASAPAEVPSAAVPSSMRSSSMRYYPRYPPGTKRTYAGSTSLRWPPASSSLNTLHNHHYLVTTATAAATAAPSQNRPRRPPRKRSMSADMAFY